ncbi:MAG: carbohydrate porin [Fusobacteriaceae bacterium]
MNKKMLTLVGCLLATAAVAAKEVVPAPVQASEASLEARLAVLEGKLGGLEKAKDQFDLWEVHGYGRTGLRASKNNDWNTSGTKPHFDNFLGRLGGEEETNYFELVASRKFVMENGAWGKVNTRFEIGNDYSFADSSQPESNDDNFDIKELFVELGNLSYLPSDYTLWAGRRYYKRNQGPFSDDFFVQSSGVGFGIENPRWAAAMIGVDLDNSEGNSDRTTAYNLDLRYMGIDKWEFQLNTYFTDDENVNEDAANAGFAARATHFIPGYYWLGKGFSQASLIYGQGFAGGSAGVNFGDWVPTGNESGTNMMRINSYGVLDINDKWAMGTEFNLFWTGDKENGFGTDGYKGGIVLRPQYRVNDNFKLIFEASYGKRDFDGSDWGGYEKYDGLGLTFAPTFTVDSGFWGRPEIRTFASYYKFDNYGQNVSSNEDVLVGVQAEFWF